MILFTKVGNKRLWLLAQRSSLKGGARKRPPVLTKAYSRQHYLWLPHQKDAYDNIAVLLSRSVRALYWPRWRAGSATPMSSHTYLLRKQIYTCHSCWAANYRWNIMHILLCVWCVPRSLPSVLFNETIDIFRFIIALILKFLLRLTFLNILCD